MMAARIRIPLREHRPNHLAMQRTLMNISFRVALPHGLMVKTSPFTVAARVRVPLRDRPNQFFEGK